MPLPRRRRAVARVLRRAARGAFLPGPLGGSLLIAAALPAVALAQPDARGAITGRVVEQGTGRPLGDVQVLVVGTRLGAPTNPDGAFRILGVPAGPVTLRAIRVGYRPATQAATVAAGGSVAVALALAANPSTLEQVVVTATGGSQRQREQGNAISQISVDSVQLAAVPNVSGLVNGRAAGVSVVGVSGTTGTGARIRIRGANSLSLANDPLLIIDGVRINSDPNSGSQGVGGQTPSRLNDLLPEDIEDIQVLKGPAATGLYGTQAANGVIQITTKRGRQGRTQWNGYAEGGAVNDRNAYPANWGAYGNFTDSTGAVTNARGCDLVTQGFGQCAQTRVINFNPLVVHSPFRTGPRLKGGANVSGGAERATYYLSADYTSEDGVYQTNALRQASVRANVTARPTSTLDVATSAGFVRSQIRLPRNDNDYFGYISNGVGGLAYDTPTSQGYDPVGPATIDQLQTGQDVYRFTGSVTATYRPLSWLSVIGVAGLDNVNRDDNQTYPQGVIPPGYFDLNGGYRESGRFTTNTSTANLSATATRRLSDALTSNTTAGFQYQRDDSRGTTASAYGLAAGTSSLNGGVRRFAASEPFARNALAGGLVQEQLAFRDRLFVAGGLRGDKNSAFGQNFGTVYYPSANLSWVLSDEPFFPKPRGLNSLRLRAAYGRSGLRPGVNDASRYYRPTAARVDGTEVSGITIGNLGDPNLRPERTSEVEGGFDLGALGGRGNLELTYYSKRSRDALVLVPSPGSSGFPAQFRNLGAVSNRGLEALLTLVPVRTRPAAWTSTFNFSTNRNRLLELGLPSPVIFNGGRQRQQVGYPLGGYWGQRITSYTVTNGAVDPNSVQFDSVPVFLGSSLPTRTLGWTNDVTFFGAFRLSALLDYKGGFKQYNSTEDFRCQLGRCEGVNSPTTSPDRQARSIASYLDGNPTGWIEKADFVKLREVSLTATLPESFARRARARALSVTLAARNLRTWKSYSGVDPEVNSVGAGGSAALNFVQSDFLSQPQVRYLTARVNVSF